MISRLRPIRAKKPVSIILFIILIFTISVFAVEAGSYGWLVRSNKVDRKFRSGKIPKSYRYYFRGWKGEPVAVIGIRKGWYLKSKKWKRFNPKKTKVRTLIKRMYSRESTNFYGAWIKDHRGRIMGIWYSDSEGAKIKMSGSKRIAFITPKPVPRKRFKRRLFD